MLPEMTGGIVTVIACVVTVGCLNILWYVLSKTANIVTNLLKPQNENTGIRRLRCRMGFGQAISFPVDILQIYLYY